VQEVWLTKSCSGTKRYNRKINVEKLKIVTEIKKNSKAEIARALGIPNHCKLT
jgi:hypothetical protein